VTTKEGAMPSCRLARPDFSSTMPGGRRGRFPQVRARRLIRRWMATCWAIALIKRRGRHDPRVGSAAHCQCTSHAGEGSGRDLALSNGAPYRLTLRAGLARSTPNTTVRSTICAGTFDTDRLKSNLAALARIRRVGQ